MIIRLLYLLSLSFLPASTLLATDSPPQSGAQYFLIEISDHASKKTLKVLTRTEHSAMTEELRNEAKLWDKALSAAEKTWESGKNTEPFPKSSIHPKKIAIIESFTNEAAAVKMLDLREKIANAGREEPKKKTAKKSKTSTSSSSSPTLSLTQLLKKIKIRKQERELRQAALQETAIQLFADKLVELSAAENTVNQPPAPPPAAN